jgi:hypothetical protein
MSKTNEGANASFRGMSRPISLYARRESNVIRHLRVTDRGEVDNYLLVKKGLIVGGDVYKDMSSENYTDEFDPSNLQDILFPGMADFIEENILQGDKAEEDRFIASYWNDLGNDVFDDWGYFFIYDVSQGKYYFPILSPINQADGVLTTQTFGTGFGELSFTITHGWREKGIFMMDVSCSNPEFEFRFGCYGNFGSDGDEDDYDMTTTYGPDNKTLYYHHHAEQDDDQEILYSYFVPYNDADNAVKPYESLYDPENTSDNSLITKVMTSGIKIYFAKQNDVKDWVIGDLLETDFSLVNGDIKAEGNVFVEGQILARGYNIGSRTKISISGEEDYNATSSIVESYYISDSLTDHRTFFIPNATLMGSSIKNIQNNTSFRFTINNVNSTYSWSLAFGEGVNSDSLKSNVIGGGCIVTFVVVFNSDEGLTATVLQETEPVPNNFVRSYLNFLNNQDYTPSTGIISSYFKSNPISDNRNFFLPNAQALYDAIPNCQDGTSFRFTINNYSNIEGGYSWILNNEFSNLDMIGVKNTSVPPGAIITYMIIITLGEGASGYLLQESELQQTFG